MTEKNCKSSDEFRKMHLLYLQKIELLTDRERAVYCNYFEYVGKPTMIVKPPKTTGSISIKFNKPKG